MGETAAVVDLDDCYIMADRHPVEEAISWMISRFAGDSLSSGTTVLRELTGHEPAYEEQDAIQDRLDQATDAYLVTGRPGWAAMRDRTASLVDGMEYEFDDVFLYPGVDLSGTSVVDNDSSCLSYVLGRGIPAYKQAVVEMLAEDYETITFIDDSERSHRYVADVDAEIDQCLAGGDGIEPYAP